MNSCSLATRLLLPGLALLCSVFGASCSSPPYYDGSAAGGGFYVSRVAAPTWGFAKREFTNLRTKGNDLLGRITGHNDGAYWDGDDMHGSPSMKIDLSEQRVYFYKGGQLAGVSPMSSGREGFDTKPGKFAIMQKDLDHKSSVYGWYVAADGTVLNKDVDIRKDPKPPGARFEPADMRYFMRIVGGIGMHQGFLPGYAASHGCIRLPARMAEAFYHASRVGTPVEIVR